MKVAVIGSTASEIISSCNVTISSLAKGGHKVYAIIAPLELSKSSSSLTSSSEQQNLLAEIGVERTFLIDTFDYSAITQANADAVNAYIKDINPSLVIMPSWKSPSYLRRILARVSLIACRGIGTVLMYEHDTNKTDFVPNIIFEVSVEPTSIEHQDNNFAKTTITGIVQSEEDIKKRAFTNNSMLEGKHSKTIRPEVIKEKFESHRTLLLGEGGLF
ncbi:MAG TPA: hypothetical protein VFG77_05020 [Nitrososphaeraceae archaeon]|nr:hypothetical protein [Nitrososphaeraceae archaeon]